MQKKIHFLRILIDFHVFSVTGKNFSCEGLSEPISMKIASGKAA